MPVSIDRTDIERYFAIKDVVESGGRRRSFQITEILDDRIRIKPTDADTASRLSYEKLSVVVEFFDTLDPKRIESSVGDLLYEHGLKDTQNESYLFGFAREYIRRSLKKGVLRRGEFGFPDETGNYIEGATKRVYVNVYERDPRARAACINLYGVACAVCGFDFQKKYGAIGEGFIHIHHLEPLARQAGKHAVIPATDLRPVCPNCHAMLHTSDPPLAIEDLVKLSSR